MRSNDKAGSALDRLTPNEKECLRRRLLPQSAKETALNLGISPHAVEKRLKMARAKLGVSSSLAAARMLARSEQYQTLAPQFSELPGRGNAAEGEGVAVGLSPTSRHFPFKGFAMIAAFCLIALVA